jgi:hypothetical protein
MRIRIEHRRLHEEEIAGVQPEFTTEEELKKPT